MQLVNTSSRYGAVSQSLHWATAALVIVLIISGKAGDIEAEESNALYYWHSSLGVLVLLLVIARIVWRFVTPPPRLPQASSNVAARLARGMHVVFYALLLALPLSGWLAASAEGAPVSLFGVVTLPRWEMSVSGPEVGAVARVERERVGPRGEANEELFEETHEVLGNVLLVLVILHALAALKHHFVDKDDVLTRILPMPKHGSHAPQGTGRTP